MAKLTGPPSPQKAPSLSGKVYVSTYRGQVVLRKWPTRETRPLNPRKAAQAEWFRQAGVLAKYLAPEQQIAAREAVQGTPLYYRDVLVMVMRGTLFGYVDEDGRKIYSVATRAGVSESLDALSQDPRTILVRSNGLWVPVTAPGDNLVPISQQDPPFVRWDVIPGPNQSGSKILATASVVTQFELKIQNLTLPTTGMIEIRVSDLQPQVASGSIWLQIEQGGGWTATAYYWEKVIQSSNNAWFRTSNANFSVFDITGFGAADGPSNAATANGGGKIIIGGLNTGRHVPIYSDIAYTAQNGHMIRCLSGGGCQNVGAITGFRVRASGGNNISGKMSVIHLE